MRRQHLPVIIIGGGSRASFFLLYTVRWFSLVVPKLGEHSQCMCTGRFKFSQCKLHLTTIGLLNLFWCHKNYQIWPYVEQKIYSINPRYGLEMQKGSQQCKRSTHPASEEHHQESLMFILPKVTTAKLSTFSRWMWKQPFSFKLCTHFILRSEGQRSERAAISKPHFCGVEADVKPAPNCVTIKDL